MLRLLQTEHGSITIVHEKHLKHINCIHTNLTNQSIANLYSAVRRERIITVTNPGQCAMCIVC